MARPSTTQLIDRADKLKADRSVFESHWQEIRDHILPLAASFTGSETAGQKGRTAILDNTGETVSEQLAAALHGFLTNPGTEWFGLKARREEVNDDADAKAWLEIARKRMLAVFASPATRFGTQLGQVYQELADFGTAVLYIPDRPGRLPLFNARQVRETCLLENDEGIIDAVFRRWKMTARQAVQQWGTAAGEKVATAAVGRRQDEMWEFLHVVMPREDARPGAREARGLPVASRWINVTDKHEIREGGFHEMPFVTPRWYVRDTESYGRGPGMKALADVKTLQRAMRNQMRGVEKLIDPPLLVADDGVLGPVRVASSSLNFVRAETLLTRSRHRPIEPLQSGARPDVGEDFMAGIRQRIASAYYNDLLRLSRDPRMTATQVLELVEETLRVLGPFLGRVQDELLGPLIDRTFGILLRAGAFPPPPPVLEGESLTVEYESPAVKAQRLSEVRALGQLDDIFLNWGTRDPSIYDNLLGDDAYRAAAERLGVPVKLLRPIAARDALRQRRAEALEAERETDEMERGAAAAQSAGQAMAAVAGAAGNDDATRQAA